MLCRWCVLVVSPVVHCGGALWWCIVVICCGVLWWCVVVVCYGGVLWWCVMVVCYGGVYWCVVVRCDGLLLWRHTSRLTLGHIDSVCCAPVLPLVVCSGPVL